MKRTHTWLIVLLVAQLALAGYLFRDTGQRSVEPVQRPLLGAPVQEIDRMTISGDAGEATLLQSGDSWILPALSQLPADVSRVDAALDRLAATRTGWAVTTSDASHQRFQVSDDGAQRHVKVYSGEVLAADFLLGTSPGFRKVHLRRAGEMPVYAVELSVHDLPATDSGWLDKSLLALSAPLRIEGADFALELSDEGQWAMPAGAAAGEEAPPVDDDRVQQLVSALANLRVQGVADIEAVDIPVSADALNLQVETTDGGFQYRFFSLDDQYLVRRSDRDTVFSLSQYDYERIAGVDRASLLAETGDTAAAEGGIAPEENGDPEAGEPQAGAGK